VRNLVILDGVCAEHFVSFGGVNPKSGNYDTSDKTTGHDQVMEKYSTVFDSAQRFTAPQTENDHSQVLAWSDLRLRWEDNMEEIFRREHHDDQYGYEGAWGGRVRLGESALA
jgi:hypothetical protein